MARKPVTVASDTPIDPVTPEVTVEADAEFGPVVAAPDEAPEFIKLANDEPMPVEVAAPAPQPAVVHHTPARLSPQTLAEMKRGKAAINIHSPVEVA